MVEASMRDVVNSSTASYREQHFSVATLLSHRMERPDYCLDV